MSTLPLLGVEGPRPSEFRMVFTRDSMDWSGSETLGDLLRTGPTGTNVADLVVALRPAC